MYREGEADRIRSSFVHRESSQPPKAPREQPSGVCFTLRLLYSECELVYNWCTELPGIVLDTRIRREPLRYEQAPDLWSPPDASLLSIHRPLDLVTHYVVHPVRGNKELPVAVHRQP